MAQHLPKQFPHPLEKSRKIAVVYLDPALHALLLSIEPFRAANRLSKSPVFQIDLIAADGAPTCSKFGVHLAPTATFDAGDIYDLVLLHSSYEFSGDPKGPIFKWLRKQAAYGSHIGAIDAAPLLLAKIGLLSGYTATSHWSTIPSFRELHPETNVVEQLFVIDRDRSTCAGQMACIDYALEMLERFCGNTLKEIVANETVYPSTRNAGNQQRHIVNGSAWHTNPTLLEAERLMSEFIEYPLTIEELANRCGVSTRELQYLFKKYLKASPKSHYLTFRLQRAKELLLYSTLSVHETGLASGFASPPSYFRAFRKRFNTSPMNYRKAFQESATLPDGRRLY